MDVMLMSPTRFVDNFVENSLSVRCNPHEITLTSRVTKFEQLKDERIQGLTLNSLGILGLLRLLTLSLDVTRIKNYSAYRTLRSGDQREFSS